TSEVRDLLTSTAHTIRDGDDERDNVTNTNAAYGRIDVLVLGEAILALGSVSPGKLPGTADVEVAAGETTRRGQLGRRPPNRAPTLSGDGVTTRLEEDTRSPGGNRVGTMLGATFHDDDFGARKGIAVVSVDGAGSGKWQYTLDGGRTWLDLGSVSRASA